MIRHLAVNNLLGKNYKPQWINPNGIVDATLTFNENTNYVITSNNGSGKTQLLLALRQFIQKQGVDAKGVNDETTAVVFSRDTDRPYLKKRFESTNHSPSKAKAFVEAVNTIIEPKQRELIYNKNAKEKSEVFLIKDHYFNRTFKADEWTAGEQYLAKLFYIPFFNYRWADKFIYLLDMPESYLSVSCQELILPTLLEKLPISFLVATTHSPFIFDNYLDEHAYTLDELVEFHRITD